MISLIEHGAGSPTAAVLDRLAAGESARYLVALTADPGPSWRGGSGLRPDAA